MVEIVEHIKFGDFDSREEGFYLTERDAPSPDEKEIIENIPFMQGVHDFSMILNERIFNNRKISYTFWLPNRMYGQRKLIEQDTKRKLMMNGTAMLYDSHDESFYWLGKCEEVKVIDDEETKTLEVRISFDCYPFMLADSEFFTDVWDTFNFNHHVSVFTKYFIRTSKKIFLINTGDASISPTIITDSDMRITLRGQQYTFKTGENKDFLMKLERGLNVLEILGTGTIRFRFRTEVMG